MDDIFPKFIIEDGNLIIGNCTYHRNMVIDEDNVIGGGGFKLEHGTITFFGESDQFGKATISDIKKCIDSNKVFTNPSCRVSIAKDYSFYYKNKNKIIDLNCRLISELLEMLKRKFNSDYHSGLCAAYISLHLTDVINQTEYFIIKDYLINNRPNDYLFWYESHLKEPRIKWLDKHIEIETELIN